MLLFLATLIGGTGQLQAQETAVVLIEPQTLALDKGQTSSVVVRVEDAANVYGVQLELFFDARKIKVLDGDEAKSGVQILAGDFLALDEGLVADNEVNNEIGRLTYALALLAPAEPASGSGTLVEFEVEALETGSSVLQLESVILASPTGTPLPVRLADAPADGDVIIVPKATETEQAPASAVAAQDSPATATPTAGNSVPPTSTAESPAVEAPATAGTAAESMPLVTETEAAAPVASGELATSTVPIPPPAEEPDPTRVNPSTAETPEVDQAVEIAAAPPSAEKEESIPAEDQPSPALTVIGQNRKSDENQPQPSTPAPAANSEGIIEGPAIAIGLVLLIVALIAIWFLRRLLAKTR